MRVGLLTLPLKGNYGGILQCYALRTVLQRLGHEVIVLRRENPLKSRGIKDYAMAVAKCLTHVFLGRQHTYFPTREESAYLYQHLTRFVDEYIQPRTQPLYSTRELRQQCLSDNYEAYVVGSDQVWRPCYTPYIGNYYLDFVEDQSNAGKIVYAASFGTDDWEYTPEETEVCAMLARKFQAISVREQSAVAICETRLGVKAEWVLDPTMLLECSDYEELVSCAGEKKQDGNLFCYFLDDSQDKKTMVYQLAAELSMTPFSTKPRTCHIKENVRGHIEECVFRPVTQWIRAFMDAEMVVTDSFHGCVFSILFNKPFWVIGNESRGMARFSSLLAIFGLQDRMILPGMSPDWNKSIDWGTVNEIRQREKERSLDFLRGSLAHSENVG